jgi:hypothetical protein
VAACGPPAVAVAVSGGGGETVGDVPGLCVILVFVFDLAVFVLVVVVVAVGVAVVVTWQSRINFGIRFGSAWRANNNVARV